LRFAALKSETIGKANPEEKRVQEKSEKMGVWGKKSERKTLAQEQEKRKACN